MKNNKSGFSMKSIIMFIAICAIGFGFFREDIKLRADAKRFEKATILLEDTYKNVQRFNKEENIKSPQYVYTDYRDVTYYKENLVLLLNYKQFNDKTGFGKKVIIRQDSNSSKEYIYIAQEFKDGSRIISINGKVLDRLYKPSDGVASYYGEEYLYKLNGK